VSSNFLRPVFATEEDDVFVADLVASAPIPTVAQRDRLARLVLGVRAPLAGDRAA
jgi:hypothetical protein